MISFFCRRFYFLKNRLIRRLMFLCQFFLSSSMNILWILSLSCKSFRKKYIKRRFFSERLCRRLDYWKIFWICCALLISNLRSSFDGMKVNSGALLKLLKCRSIKGWTEARIEKLFLFLKQSFFIVLWKFRNFDALSLK